MWAIISAAILLAAGGLFVTLQPLRTWSGKLAWWGSCVLVAVGIALAAWTSEAEHRAEVARQEARASELQKRVDDLTTRVDTLSSEGTRGIAQPDSLVASPPPQPPASPRVAASPKVAASGPSVAPVPRYLSMDQVEQLAARLSHSHEVPNWKNADGAPWLNISTSVNPDSIDYANEYLAAFTKGGAPVYRSITPVLCEPNDNGVIIQVNSARASERCRTVVKALQGLGVPVQIGRNRGEQECDVLVCPA